MDKFVFLRQSAGPHLPPEALARPALDNIPWLELYSNTSGYDLGTTMGERDKPVKEKKSGRCVWEFISGNEDLYTDIIEPVGHKAKERNERFQVEYAKVVNKFTLEFSKEYCAPDGSIVWDKLVRFNSGKRGK